MSGGGASSAVQGATMPRLIERSPPLSLTDANRLSSKDSKRKAGSVLVGEDGGAVARVAPVVWKGRLVLYESVGVNRAGSVGKASSAGEAWCNAVAFVGGPVWAMDWLGEVDGLFGEDGPGHQVVAVVGQAEGCHETLFGQPVKGKNYIQIWSMGKLAPQGKGMTGKPELLMLIGVDSGVVHDLAWCRWEAMLGQEQSLGLLAVASGNGSLLILDIPLPDRAWGPDRRVIEVAPVVSLLVDSGIKPFTGHGTSIRWGPDPQGKEKGFVGFGCSTGEVFLVPVKGTKVSGDAMQKEAEEGHIVLKTDEHVGVLCLDFCGDDGKFLVTGLTTGELYFWDTAKPLWYAYTVKSGRRCLITSIRWLSDNGGIVAYTMDSGSVQLYFNKIQQGRIVMERPFASWGCDISAMQEKIVVASSEGLVIQSSLDYLAKLCEKSTKTKIKREPGEVLFEVSKEIMQPHADNPEMVHVVGMTWAGKGAMDVDVHTSRYLREGESLRVKKEKKEKTEKTEMTDDADKDDENRLRWKFPDKDLAVHRVKFHPGGEGLLLWAGRAGLMYCSVVPTDDLPDF